MEDVIQYYQSGKCPFCNQLLHSKHDGSYIKLDEDCRNPDCDVDYFLMLNVAYFTIGGTKFVVYLNENNMTAIANGVFVGRGDNLFEYPKALIITKENYQQQIDKIKKLQAFS